MSPTSPTHLPADIRLIHHGIGKLRLLVRLSRLKRLLDDHSFWAVGRSPQQLGQMLLGSQAVVSVWCGQRLVGFGRATSDGIYRAVLWDVVVDSQLQGLGIGRLVVEALLEFPAVARAERIYLMTTNSEGFYEKLGFGHVLEQRLMLREGITDSDTGHRSVPGGHG
ncbi:GNAT family N-acetyltransferase [Synechococcus sp. Cruz-9H2]|nr:GNAT family N-acetyltransferase [Synechococcus sp. Cruz-9H2]MCP9845140.1 GNAT family N-acetyltransferase [Synechococcus sp. Edmonson 11F2]MCP9857310.1 GNAT family N-acetyltransferase [Synechococcus sp. Cruz-9C9]MCP9864563.1 GNAT family N-acetyltransferase [Synechococcus sp. Cruz-7E5]MCP9871832.1 GNAT family N-acetyltransferase [Synechococcus sp. Cruz-7B9]